jgi:hypothetical protein
VETTELLVFSCASGDPWSALFGSPSLSFGGFWNYLVFLVPGFSVTFGVPQDLVEKVEFSKSTLHPGLCYTPWTFLHCLVVSYTPGHCILPWNFDFLTYLVQQVLF